MCGGGSACGDLGRRFRVGVAICVVTNQLMVVPDGSLGWVWLFVWLWIGVGSNFWECKSVLQIVFCICKLCMCFVYVIEWV